MAKPTMTGHRSNRSKFQDGGLAALTGHITNKNYNKNIYGNRFNHETTNSINDKNLTLAHLSGQESKN